MEFEDETADAFTGLLKSARERVGMTQLALAEKLGMTQTTISQLEKGPYVGMRFVDVARLCAFYHIPLGVVASILGFGPVLTEASTDGFDALTAGLSESDANFVRRVVTTLVKGLR